MEIELLPSGRQFFTRSLELIDTAERTIVVQMYLISTTGTGKEFLNALTNAADRGIEVYVLIDSIGCSDCPDSIIDSLTKKGISIRKFSPALSRWTALGHRLHHKIIIRDENAFITGGNNISDEYILETEDLWLDYSVLVKDSTITTSLKEYALELHHKKKPHAGIKKSTELSVDINDWINRKTEITARYIKLIQNAKQSIWIASAYFLPGRKFRKAVENAAKRGVQIRLILPGTSDIPGMIWAVKSYYPWCYRHGIELILWTKSNLHAKVILVDNQICSIGSYNINELSRFNSIELNITADYSELTSSLKHHMEAKIAEGGKKVDLRQTRNQLYWFNYFVRRMMRFALTLLFHLARNHKAGT